MAIKYETARDLYDVEGFEESLSVDSTDRKFQTSIIIKQDTSKSGILSFLQEIQQSSQQLPSSGNQTIRPSGDYNA